MTTATLVLDIRNRPVKTVSWADAVGAVFRGVAEIVTGYEGDCVYTNEHDIDVYDPRRYGSLGKFFDEELLENGKVRVSLLRPAVIRVFNIQSKRKRLKFNRQNLYLRDGYRCQYAGCETTKLYEELYGTKDLPAKVLNFEHVIPKDQGGGGGWKNIVASCVSCNTRKRNRTPEQAGMMLLRHPHEPVDLPLISTKVKTPDEWRSWLYMTVELEK